MLCYIVLFRVVFITVLAFGCLNHWHWKASIISHLSIILPQTPFNALEELVDSSYQITTIGNSYYSKFWSEAQDRGLLKTIAETKFLDEDASLKSSEEEALAQTQSGPFSFFMVYRIQGVQNTGCWIFHQQDGSGFGISQEFSLPGYF